MLTVFNLSKSYDLQTLFEDVSFSLNPGERVGLIGANGCGKTTLMRILTGEELPSSGHVSRDSDLRIGYLPQGFEPDPALTLRALQAQMAGDAIALEQEFIETASAFAEHPEDETLAARYDRLLSRMESADSSRVARILSGLGLDTIDPDLPVRLLSGGQKTRLSLALVLLSDPQLLLLDEPTNHLDVTMLEWLEGWLQSSPCGALIISHDRTFLDHTVTRILEMDPVKKQVREWAGNYSAYEELRQAEIERQWAAYTDQQLEVQRMKQDIARIKAQAQQTNRESHINANSSSDARAKGYQSYLGGIATKIAKKATSREKKLERYLNSDERVEKPLEGRPVRFEFKNTPHLGRAVLQTDRLTVGFDPAAPLLANLDLSAQSGQRIVLTGPNGSGKTTLLRTLVGQIPALGGGFHLGSSVRLGYMSQDQSMLDPNQTALETILPEFGNQTEARRFLGGFLFHGDEPLKLNSLLSFGQRARLMLALLVARRCNFLLMDEPVNHLDIPSRAQFEQALSGFDGTVLAVLHDRYLNERFADEVWWAENGTVMRRYA